MKRTYWFIIGILFLSSCHKDIKREEEDNLPKITEESYEIANQEIALNQLTEAIDYNIDLFSFSVEQESYSSKAKPVCPTVSIEFESEAVFPHTVVIDFEDGCKGKRDHDISGTLSIYKSDYWLSENSVRTISFDNFVIDGVIVSGTQTVTNDGITNGVLYFSVSSDLKFTWPSGFCVERTLSTTRSYIAGIQDSSSDLTSFVVQVSGTITDVTSEGNTFEKTTSSPIVLNSECDYIVSGIVDVYKNDVLKFTLDYGDGTCDRYATISLGDESQEVSLNNLSLN